MSIFLCQLNHPLTHILLSYLSIVGSPGSEFAILLDYKMDFEQNLRDWRENKKFHCNCFGYNFKNSQINLTEKQKAILNRISSLAEGVKLYFLLLLLFALSNVDEISKTLFFIFYYYRTFFRSS